MTTVSLILGRLQKIRLQDECNKPKKIQNSKHMNTISINTFKIKQFVMW